MTRLNVGGGFFASNRSKTLEEALDRAQVSDTILINNAKASLSGSYIIKQTQYIEGVGEDYVNLYLAPKSAGFVVASASLYLKNLRIIVPHQANAISTLENANAKIVLDHCQVIHEPKIDARELFPALMIKSADDLHVRVKLTDTKVDYASIDAQKLTLDHAKIGSNYLAQSEIGANHFDVKDSSLYNTLIASLSDESSVFENITTNGRLSLMGQFTLQGLTCRPLKTTGTKKKQLKVKRAFEKGWLPQGQDGSELYYVQAQANRFGGQLTIKADATHPVKFERGNSKEFSGVKYRAFEFNQVAVQLENLQLTNRLPLANVVHGGSLKLVDTTDKLAWQVDKETEIGNDNSESELFKTEKTKQKKPALQRLDELIGLQTVKDQIHQYIAQVRMDATRRANGLLDDVDDNTKSSLHMVFAGNPGTGKTVVAGIVAQVLYENGVLKSNKLISCGQADLVGRYVGETPQKTAKVVKRALDGVLLIDEAYQLAPTEGNGSDFNNEAVTQLIKMMEMKEYRDRLVVIMAGYDQDMRHFFKVGNAGLQSRFRNWINFPDYSTQELCQILEFQRKGQGLIWDTRPGHVNPQQVAYGAIKELQHTVGRNGGNGRLARNLISDMKEAMDTRLFAIDPSQLSEQDLQRITAEDVKKAFNKEKEKALKLA